MPKSTSKPKINKKSKRVSKPISYDERVALVESLFGSVPATITLEEAKKERAREICGQ